MSVPISRAPLDHLDRETAARVRALFDLEAAREDLDEWPHDHAPGEAWPIDGSIEIALEDAEGGLW